MNYNKNSIISDIVAHDYSTAEIFKLNKIDFCCNGNRSLLDASIKRGVDVDQLIGQLSNSSILKTSSGEDYNSWPVDLLADYIQRMHHTYVEAKLPIILGFLDKLRKVHGPAHPELYKVYELFEGATTALMDHMQKEESILFPYARVLGKGNSEEAMLAEKVDEFLIEMKEEHDIEGNRFREIRSLTNDYTPPKDGCTTYRVAFSMLEEFEDNLHKHVHLENNILSPKLVDSLVNKNTTAVY